MELTLCGPSAFRFYRIPPQYLALLPEIHAPRKPASWRPFFKTPLLKDFIGLPLHLLRTSKNSCSRAQNIEDQLWSTELPLGAVQETNHGFDVTSPAMTLLSLARMKHVSDTRLTMAAYEMCGSFAIFPYRPDMEALLVQSKRGSRITVIGEWQPVGKPYTTSNDNTGPYERGESQCVDKPHAVGNLWKRDPLLSLEELNEFVLRTKGYRGNKRLAKCAAQVTGICASPFEVQASMLLSLPIKDGGQGFSGLCNNAPIRLNSKASLISGGKHRCYADLYFEDTVTGSPLDIECQSQMIHDNGESYLSDADRAAALQLMGVDVLPLTFDQLFDYNNYRAVCSLIAKKLGVRPARRSDDSRKAETELRHTIFTEWEQMLLP